MARQKRFELPSEEQVDPLQQDRGHKLSVTRLW
jgi:hypothetical protein